MAKPFERWEREDIELRFGLQGVKTHPVLTDWLNAQERMTEEETLKIKILRTELEEDVADWNEEEVKLFFINDLIRMIHFRRPNYYKTFAQRTLACTVNDIHNKPVEMRGRVEMVVSAGKQKPRQPFFFIHEYKPQRPSSVNDPEGQLLSAMLTVQTLNQTTYPLYGVYIQGKYWNFMILKDKDYTISESFNAAKEEDLNQIVSMLKRCKYYIEKQLGLV